MTISFNGRTWFTLCVCLFPRALSNPLEVRIHTTEHFLQWCFELYTLRLIHHFLMVVLSSAYAAFGLADQRQFPLASLETADQKASEFADGMMEVDGNWK